MTSKPVSADDSASSAGDGTEPYAGFRGTVGKTFAGSESWWPDRNKAPDGAPNVVIMLADDLGFSDLGCYGSEIPTPNLDRLAASGVQATNFHVTPMCSPTRAAMLTGLNPHDAGIGHVAHSDPGFPGYAMELSDHSITIAEVLRDNGYATMMFGKWHLAKDSDLSAAGSKKSWPVQRGFETYYGILDGFTNFHHPHRLISGNDTVEIDQYPDDYYFTDDITDRAISKVRETKMGNPAKPFFMYFAHGAVHAPLQAKEADIAKYRGEYSHGWDELRNERYERLVNLGIFPKGTTLPDRNSEAGSDVVAWDTLDPRQQELFAEYMAVYAAMVDNLDWNVGRLLDSLEELGELDNTIFVFTSDNGASREGEEWGTASYYTHLIGEPEWENDHDRLKLIGGPQTIPHFPRGWAMACNTPFRLYKVNTHAGGHQVPMFFSWPAGLDVAGERRTQYAHVTDLLPTILEYIGIPMPTERQGLPLKTPVGTTMSGILADPQAPSVHTEQHYEMWGHRGFYRDGWEIVTCHQPFTEFTDAEWELYNLVEDPTECRNLAAEMPDKVAELAAAWEQAAWDNQVFPLEEGTMLKHILRPPWTEEIETSITIPHGTPTLERWRSQRLLWVRAFTASVSLEYHSGDEGMLVAHGDQGGGYALYVLNGELIFAHNNGHVTRRLNCGPVANGASTITIDAAAPGGNIWNISIIVDGKVVGSEEGFEMFFTMAPFEGIDVGIDRRSPVDWDVYEAHGCFPWTGTLHSVTYTPGEKPEDSPTNMIGILQKIGKAYE